MPDPATEIAIFSTCPASAGLEPAVFRHRVVEVARWSERQQCRGILVYTDNSLVDPWLVASLIVESTASLVPLVAVQPAYMHPYTVAKMVTSFGALHGRAVHLNMVAGGFTNDLRALGDATPHDRRYDRLREYTTIVKRLLGGETVTMKGDFYQVERLRLSPPLAPALMPWIWVSASSPAGLAVARALDAVLVQYPTAPDDTFAEDDHDGTMKAVRVGIVTRADEDEAWRIARARFPEDRAGQIAHALAIRASDSVWHQKLSGPAAEATPYWLVPFHNYKTFCPYLVGAYERVAGELARHLRHGVNAFILDVPGDEDDLRHARIAFEHAMVEAG
jgi:alkanesulfonate monooxygenase